LRVCPYSPTVSPNAHSVVVERRNTVPSSTAYVAKSSSGRASIRAALAVDRRSPTRQPR